MDEVALITGEGGWVIKKRVAHADDVLAHDNAATPRINDHSNVGINVSPCYVIINLTRCDEAIVN